MVNKLIECEICGVSYSINSWRAKHQCADAHVKKLTVARKLKIAELEAELVVLRHKHKQLLYLVIDLLDACDETLQGASEALLRELEHEKVLQLAGGLSEHASQSSKA